MTSHRIPGGRCPECGYQLDGASTLLGDARPPGPGDFSVCIECMAVLRFDEMLQLRTTSLAERGDAGDLERVVRAVQMANLSRGKP